MSTRSIVGIKSESGLVGRYVHSDGYPEAMLLVLRGFIARDGAAKAGETILSQPQGWSYLDADYTENYLGKDRAELIEGYGLAYRDSTDGLPIRHEEIEGTWSEYAYYIDTETGDITWFSVDDGGWDAPKLDKSPVSDEADA